MEEYIKVYEHIYDNPKDKEGNDKPNKLLGEFKIIYGDMNDYAFSVIGVNREDGEPYNIIGDEVSGMYSERGGTACRVVKINLERGHYC